MFSNELICDSMSETTNSPKGSESYTENSCLETYLGFTLLN